MASSFDVVSEKLSAMQTPERVIEIRLEPTIQALAGTLDRFSAQAEQQAAGLQAILAAVRDNTNACAGILASMRDGSAANSEEMRQFVEQITRSTTEVSNAVTLTREEAQNSERVAQEALTTARHSVEQMTGVGESFIADVSAHLERMQAILGERDRRLEQWAQTIIQTTLRQENILTIVAGNLAEFSRITEMIADRGIPATQEASVNMPLIPGAAA